MKYTKYLLILLVAQACKKGPGLRGYMTGTVNGKAWSANCKNSANGQLAATIYNNSSGWIYILGEEVSGPGDTSTILLSIGQFTNEGQQQPLAQGNPGLSYSTRTDVYSTDSPWSRGSFYYTGSMNELQGTFYATLYDAQNNPVDVSMKFDAPVN